MVKNSETEISRCRAAIDLASSRRTGRFFGFFFAVFFAVLAGRFDAAFLLAIFFLARFFAIGGHCNKVSGLRGAARIG